ncbi:MAG TPA: 3-deoxy-manno-octulosonate cytidylyltransferase, partial [Bacteroidetes bacterium]|nr:3-deoxy-manno-octulosonate cytidylyltransferase [Bacteroidota bacterium]
MFYRMEVLPLERERSGEIATSIRLLKLKYFFEKNNTASLLNIKQMAKNIDSLGIIPARFGSTRFPGKPLADIGGQSMIRRVVGQVVRSSLSEVIVATDDDRIFRHVEASNNRVTMTSPFHKSGTGRCAEVAAREEFRSVKWVVNIQGDEPFIQPSQIDHLLSFLKNNSQFDIATPAFPLSDRDQLSDPHIVKTVFDKNNRALYFSRSPIPFLKKTTEENKPPNVTFYKHIGIYAFKKEVL